jgi:N-acetylneuraminic acid mutarotase
MKNYLSCRSISARALLALVLFTAGGCLVVKAASFHPEATNTASQRTLTFADRVAYQRAVEEVYWQHRIWPKENPRPKPSLDEVTSQEQIKQKVDEYLRNSQLLADQWQRPVPPEQLQAEMDRVASHTRQPAVLRELFAALGHDPFIIAECLARPTLSERLVDELHAGPNPPAGTESLESSAPKTETSSVTPDQPALGYYLPQIASFPVEDAAGGRVDTWNATSTTGAPQERHFHTAVWTGTEMIVWGGYNNTVYLNTGARYNPSTDSWVATSSIGAPAARLWHTAVWTGSEMIVWGGINNRGTYLKTGGRYNPTTDTWLPTATPARGGRGRHTGVWTGTEMIVWGGINNDGSYAKTGERYNPTTDSWLPTSTPAPAARIQHTAVWTGTEMIVWGGVTNAVRYLKTGGRYSPTTDSWLPTANMAPAARVRHTAVWTGTEMIVWGGSDNAGTGQNTGGRYNPTTDSWLPTATTAPAARADHTAVWTGSEMIVWGGYGSDYLNTGGRYNPSTDSWVVTTTTGAPDGRSFHTAVWTGTEMIVWGGINFSGDLNTGGRYSP